jgi:hypothetical protein
MGGTLLRVPILGPLVGQHSRRRRRFISIVGDGQSISSQSEVLEGRLNPAAFALALLVLGTFCGLIRSMELKT